MMSNIKACEFRLHQEKRQAIAHLIFVVDHDKNEKKGQAFNGPLYVSNFNPFKTEDYPGKLGPN